MTTDLSEEAITSLELVGELIPEAADRAWLWKWAIVAMDNALQNLFVLAVAHTSGLNVIRFKKSEFDAWREGKGNFPDGPLLPFFELLEKAQGDDMRKFVHSQPLKLSGDEEASIGWLHRRRNEFIHYVPMGLSVDVPSIKLSLRNCGSVARRLITETGTIMWDHPDQASRSLTALDRIDASLPEF
jgi:hypothetical protein